MRRRADPDGGSEAPSTSGAACDEAEGAGDLEGFDTARAVWAAALQCLEALHAGQVQTLSSALGCRVHAGHHMSVTCASVGQG